jgi:pimeloyl-ACP methyl ester carboxylesterase
MKESDKAIPSHTTRRLSSPSNCASLRAAVTTSRIQKHANEANTMTSADVAPTLVKTNDTHSLALYTHGPEPSSAQYPVVLFISGVASSRLNWAAVVRQLSPSIRCYTYDRAGYGNSDVSPYPPTAENIAQDLSHLVKNMPTSNPIILVGHSWAGVLVNEFIALTGNGSHIAGLVLVDANHESMPQILNVNDPDLQAISEGVNHYIAKGIAAEHKLTQAEWDALMAEEATAKYATIARKEDDEYAASFETLRDKRLSERQPLLGDKPVCIIGGMRSRDWNGMYKAGVARGNGSEEQRSRVRVLIETADRKSESIMRRHLELSTKTKLMFARDSGHFIQMTQPDIVVDGVRWVLATRTAHDGNDERMLK